MRPEEETEDPEGGSNKRKREYVEETSREDDARDGAARTKQTTFRSEGGGTSEGPSREDDKNKDEELTTITVSSAKDTSAKAIESDQVEEIKGENTGTSTSKSKADDEHDDEEEEIHKDEKDRNEVKSPGGIETGSLKAEGFSTSITTSGMENAGDDDADVQEESGDRKGRDNDSSPLLYTDNIMAAAVATNDHRADAKKQQLPKSMKRREAGESSSPPVAQFLRQEQQQFDSASSSYVEQATMLAFTTDVRLQIAQILQSHQLLCFEVDNLKRIVVELTKLLMQSQQRDERRRGGGQQQQRQRQQRQQQEQEQQHQQSSRREQGASEQPITNDQRLELLRQLFPQRREGDGQNPLANSTTLSAGTRENDTQAGNSLDVASVLAAQVRQQHLPAAQALSNTAVGSDSVGFLQQLQILGSGPQQQLQGLFGPVSSLMQQLAHQQQQGTPQQSMPSSQWELQRLLSQSSPSTIAALTPQHIAQLQQHLDSLQGGGKPPASKLAK